MTIDVSKPTRISVDAGAWQGELAHNWNYIGYDEINYTYTPEGQELLGTTKAAAGDSHATRVQQDILDWLTGGGE